jgi:DNA-binding NarL/FixJ family response regulator
MGLFGVSQVFVGREEEARLLAEHARRARTEAAATLLLGGEAGVGKTRLLEEFAADSGNGLVAGGCLELGVDGLPFAPFVTVLRRLLRDLGPERFAAAAGSPSEIARLLPELGPPPEERPEARGRLFEQVLRLLSAAAEPAGLTVVLDDLHWADSATRHLLVFLVRNLDTARVQILAGYRTDDLRPTHPLRRLLPELERLPAVTHLQLRPLTPEQVAAQARAIRGTELPAEEMRLLYARTAGNPLFVESFLEQPEVDACAVPERPRELLLGPLRTLGDDAREVAAVVSTGGSGGRRVEHRLLARVAGLDEDRLEAALRDLVDANLLRVEESGYRFRHALLREAVHAEILPGRHARLHLAYATALEEDPSAHPGAGADAELAHHYHEAHERPRALSAAWRAARRAHESYGYDEQLRMLERVIDLWDQVPDAEERVGAELADVLEEASEAAIDSGETSRGLALAEQGLRVLPDTDDAPTATRRALLLRRRGQARRDLDDGDALADLRASARVLPADSPHRPSVLATLAGELALWGRFEEAAETAETAMAEARASGDEDLYACARMQRASIRRPPGGAHWPHTSTEMHARITLASMDSHLGHTDPALREIEAVLERARAVGDPTTETRATALRVALLWEGGRAAEAVATGRAGLERARDLSTVRTFGTLVAVNLAEALYYVGEFAECRGVAGRALSWNPMLLYRLNLHARRGLAAIAMGDLDAARDDQRRQRDAGSRLTHTQDELPAALLDLELVLADADADAAVRTARALLDDGRVETWPPYGWHVLEAAARALRAGRAAGADGTGPLRTGIARAYDRMRAVGPAQAAFRSTIRAHLADTATPDEDPGVDARAAWRAAVADWRAAEDPYQRARALLYGAEADAADGDRAAATAAVREAAGLADCCGAAPLRLRCADLARRLGTTLDGSTPGAAAGPGAPPGGLTPRETEVLRLVAHGRTNAQIAEKLFISAKTASVHVSNILAKLGVPNRATAAARARSLGLD